jgi:dihydroxyacetone kinase
MRTGRKGVKFSGRRPKSVNKGFAASMKNRPKTAMNMLYHKYKEHEKQQNILERTQEEGDTQAPKLYDTMRAFESNLAPFAKSNC